MLRREFLIGTTAAAVLGGTRIRAWASCENTSTSSGPVLDVSSYGAKGDGLTDDTNAIQAAVNACPLGGTVSGGSRNFVVGSINLKSDMTLANFNLKTRPSNIDLVSPVTIGTWYNTQTLRNIVVNNVHVNGNRALQNNIGGYEDGGRHGFRLIGHVDNVTIMNCSATYCASDGIMLYSGPKTRASSEPANTPLLTRIKVLNCEFSWNRRHGGSGDSISQVSFVNCKFNDNGRDVTGSGQGARGALDGGYRYGNGFDMESYGVGSVVKDVVFDGCEARRNVRQGMIFYDPTLQTTANWIPNERVRLSGCTIDYGVENREGTTAIEFTCYAPYRTGGAVYRNIAIDNCVVYGSIVLRAVNFGGISNVLVTNSQSTIGVLDNALNITVSNLSSGGKRFYNYQSTVTYL